MRTNATVVKQQASDNTLKKATITNLVEYRVHQVLNSYAVVKNRQEDSLPSRVQVRELFSPTYHAAVIIRRRNGVREFYLDSEKSKSVVVEAQK